MFQNGSHIKNILKLKWDLFKTKFPHKVSRWIDRTISQMLACRTEALGAHLMVCPTEGCGQFRLVPHSCKQKICSSCGKVQNDHWLAKIAEITLPVVHHHITFTVPFELRPLIQANYASLLNAMYQTSAKAVMKYCREHKFLPGLFTCSQTYGTALNFNPHLHMAVSAGGLSLDGKRWVSYDHLDARAIGKIWVALFYRAIRKLHRKGKLRGLAHLGFSSYPTFNQFLNQIAPDSFKYKGSRKGWSIYVSERDKASPSPVGYIGRYVRTPPISELRIQHVSAQCVTFTVRDYSLHREDIVAVPSLSRFGRKIIHHIPKRRKERPKRMKSMTLPILDFIGLLIQHISPKYFKVPRWYGLYANQKKSLREKAASLLPESSKIPPQLLAKSAGLQTSWRERRILQNGEDPLLCTQCGAELICHTIFGKRDPLLAQFTFKQLEKMPLKKILSLIKTFHS